MEAKEGWARVVLFEKEVKKAEGLGLAGGEAKSGGGQGARQGKGTSGNGVLTVRIESEKGLQQARRAEWMGGKSRRVGRVAGSAGPLYYSGMSPLEGGQVNDAR